MSCENDLIILKWYGLSIPKIKRSKNNKKKKSIWVNNDNNNFKLTWINCIKGQGNWP